MAIVIVIIVVGLYWLILIMYYGCLHCAGSVYIPIDSFEKFPANIKFPENLQPYLCVSARSHGRNFCQILTKLGTYL